MSREPDSEDLKQRVRFTERIHRAESGTYIDTGGRGTAQDPI
jgi:hypothetical protein